MSQRHSEYKRLPNDAYYTPAWVTTALLPHIPRRIHNIVEPAAGNKAIVKVLRKAGYTVKAADISTGHNFLASLAHVPAIVTNPPYGLAQEFIEQALDLTEGLKGFVAMLLRVDYDSAATRRHLFAEHPAFVGKIVLTKRIRWISNSTGSPSENHAWFLWSWTNKQPPTIRYAP